MYRRRRRRVARGHRGFYRTGRRARRRRLHKRIAYGGFSL